MDFEQYYYVAAKVLCLGVMLALSSTAPSAMAADDRITPADRGPDPLLTGARRGPCNPNLASPNYVAGTDVYGRPVVSADVAGSPRVVLNSDTVYPKVEAPGHHDVIVSATVPGLKDAVDPPPACPQHHRHG